MTAAGLAAPVVVAGVGGGSGVVWGLSWQGKQTPGPSSRVCLCV